MNMTVLDRKPDRGQSNHELHSASSIATCIRLQVDRTTSTPSCRSAGWSIAQTIGGRSRQGLAKASIYPRMSPGLRHADGRLADRRRRIPGPTCR